MKMEQRYEDILKGLPVLILVILALFLLRTTGLDRAPGATHSYGDVFVQIAGDIKYPGVYSFDCQTDIKELIEKGGGIESVAHATGDLTALPLHSGSKLTVQEDKGNCTYIHEEISSFHKITLGLPVSINMESEEGLAAIPGIGPVVARAIAKERSNRGGFKALEELRSVYGIGEKKYKKIIAYVTL